MTDNEFNFIDILRPAVTVDEVADITRMSRGEQDKLKLQINQFDLRLILPEDRQRRGFICPVCGNGSGRSGDGIVPSIKLDNGGNEIIVYNCFSCSDFSGDLYKIIADLNNLDSRKDFCKILAIGKKIMATTPIHSDLPPLPTKTDFTDEQKSFVANQIEEFAANIEDLPVEDRRALSIDTFKHFHCGYAPLWKIPFREDLNLTSRRIIIPTGNDSYNAILPTRDRTEQNIKWKALNVNEKQVFNADAIVANQPVIVVEGEIDAMSIWQAAQVNVCATGGASSWDKLIPYLDNIPADDRKNYSFVILFDYDKGGIPEGKKFHDALSKLGFKSYVDFIHKSDKVKVDANDILIRYGDDDLKSIVDKILDAANEYFKQDTQPTVEDIPAPKRRIQSSQDEMPDCPIDLVIPYDFDFSQFGIMHKGKIICHNPIVITKKLVDVDSGETYSEIAIWDPFKKKWYYRYFSDDVLLDYRLIGRLMKCGVHFRQEDCAKKLSQYFEQLPVQPQNINRIPRNYLYNYTGWTDDSYTKFIYPDHVEGGDVLNDTKSFYRNKFESKGNYDKWRWDIWNSFMDEKSNAVFNILFATALAAPATSMLNLRNFQIVIWCDTGKGKTALAKKVMSIYGNPEELKNTFNGTTLSIIELRKKYNFFPLYIDEFQSAREPVKKDIVPVFYGIADGKGRSRLSRDGQSKSTNNFYGTAIITAEQPIIPDSADAGIQNRVLCINSDNLFPSGVRPADVHRFYNRNYGFFGTIWVDFMIHNHDLIQSEFEKFQPMFDNIANENNWSNGWNDPICACYVLEYLALKIIDPTGTLTPELFRQKFFANFKVINDAIPKNQSMTNQSRAIEMLEDYVNSHPRNFKCEIQTREGIRMVQNVDGAGYCLQGYQFKDGTFGFVPSELKKILQVELGFSSAEAILHGWQKDNLLMPATNGRPYACRRNVTEGYQTKRPMLICFNKDTINANIPTAFIDDESEE